ncbi:putative bifunctional dTTP/UTP pyrophosphatase/methyltransferase protein [Saccoglossus kowalevskii]|uniref:Acetylserotonin O-methyltransferase n=1 Tax=Saccoglossus kowalevskii TaxID=10224 RepID=A0ABM0MJS3_SACKO|nr:PREDICTED: N-acetylserotonin O-methyltransferase-like protein-like [Saccoglossus kowalevskii]
MAEAMDVFNDLHMFIISQTLITAAKLNMFDHMSGRTMTSGDLADITGGDAKVTEEMLDALVAMGYVKKEDQSYTNTVKANKYMVKSSPTSLVTMAHSRDKSYYLFSDMADAVKEGRLLKKDTGDRFKEIAEDHKKRTAFLKSMDSMIQNFRSPVLMNSFDFSSYSSACDLGGGNGGLSYSLSEKYPEMEITILDLPAVVAAAEKLAKPTGGVTSNVAFRAGDMLTDELPKVDMILLASIIHDWSLDKVNLILSRTYAALNPGGAVVIVETLYEDQKERSSITAHLFSLHMSMLGGGKQWSAFELRSLLQEHGFTDVKVKKSDFVYGVVIATKPT